MNLWEVRAAAVLDHDPYPPAAAAAAEMQERELLDAPHVLLSEPQS